MLSSNHFELALGVIFAVYIVFQFNSPSSLSNMINTPVGTIVASICAILIFIQTKQKVVGILGFIAVYELIRRSRESQFMPSENIKLQDFAKYNDFPVTLEEEMVAKMAPIVTNSGVASADYKPVMEDTHNASSS